jgi:hypothetical protein
MIVPLTSLAMADVGAGHLPLWNPSAAGSGVYVLNRWSQVYAELHRARPTDVRAAMRGHRDAIMARERMPAVTRPMSVSGEA